MIEVAKLKKELTQQTEESTKRFEACKQDVFQAYFMGCEAVAGQAFGLYRDVDFAELGSGKIMVDGKLVEE